MPTRLLLLAVPLLAAGCTANEMTSAVADLRWNVSQVFAFSAPPPAPAYPAPMAGGAAGPTTTAEATAAAVEER